MNRETIIDVQSLTRTFGKTTAVDAVSLEVAAGNVYGLVGPNGSGKTTLTRMLCGLMKPTSGKAFVLGHDVTTSAETVRQSVGYMSQQFSLYGDLTAQENINFFAEMHGIVGAHGKERKAEVIRLMQLEPHLDKPAQVLSGGWRQRLALATTILHSPTLMFLDEPTAGIDPVARRELWDILFDLAAAGSNIFMTTQYMDEVERCSQVGYIYLSKLIVSGTPAELKRQTLAAASGGRYVEIECTGAPLAVQWLRKQSYCHEATVFGTTVHGLMKPEVSDNQVRASVAAAGFKVTFVRTIEPTLEDVFVTLTKRAAADREKA